MGDPPKNCFILAKVIPSLWVMQKDSLNQPEKLLDVCLLMLPCEFLTAPRRNPISTDHPGSKRNYSQFIKWNQNLICLFNDTRLLYTGPTKQPVYKSLCLHGLSHSTFKYPQEHIHQFHSCH